MVPSLLPAKFQTLVPLEEQLRAIARAAQYCPAERWEGSQEEGVLLLASHFLECEWWQRIATSGAATAIAQGQGASPPKFDDLNSTIYGQQYNALRRTLPTTLGFVE